MNQLEDFKESGILELYVMGATSEAENSEVERMLGSHPELKQEIDQISLSLEAYALAHAVEPNPKLKPLVLAMIDFIDRMQQGEAPANPPILTPASKPEDFAEWLNRDDLREPEAFDDVFVKVIGVSMQATTAIVWVKDMPYSEIHTDEFESFLIVEGSCDFHLGNKIVKLGPGDHLTVPLNTQHSIKVTSEVPCKAILQRVAA
jgi:mannose-6-phosphate isomerase-like protein (cupin superfamily)